MANAEKQLDIIIKAIAENTAALDETKAKVDGLTTAVNTSAATHEKHAAATHAAAAAERDLTKEGREAAKAMGEMGAKGGELFERFTALSGVMGSGGPMGLALGGALVGLGLLVEGGKKVEETYQEQQRAAADLAQATKTTGQSYEDLNKRFEDFVSANVEFIPNENEAKDTLTSFVRAGFDADTSMKALSSSLDIAALKHEDLKTAADQLLLAMEGSGKGIKDLGVSVSDLVKSDENAVKAHKDFEKATAEVAKRQDELASAQDRLKIVEDELSGKHKLTAADADKLANAHKAVTDAANNLTTADADQKKALDDVNSSMTTSKQVLDDVKKRTEDGKKAIDDHQQAVNHLSHEWDLFASQTGPEIGKAFDGIITGLADVVGWIDAAISGLNAMASWAAAHPGEAGRPTGGTPGGVGSGGPLPPGMHDSRGVPTGMRDSRAGAVGSNAPATAGHIVTFNIYSLNPQEIANAVDSRLSALLTST